MLQSADIVLIGAGHNGLACGSYLARAGLVGIGHEAHFYHLDITSRDNAPCKNWRHFQQIKNELIGPEYEAMELFPAESRLVDAGNEYHLWVHATPGVRFPV